MRISSINSQNYLNNQKYKFSGTANTMAKNIDTICESKIFTKKVWYSTLSILLAGTLGYLVLKPENEVKKRASRYVPKS